MSLMMKTRHTEKIDPKAKIAGERMYFNANGTKLVGEGNTDAAVLAVAEGHRMHPALVKRFGIKGGKLAANGENKALKGVQNKGV